MDEEERPTAIHCPICMEIFQAPIVQCKSGHSFCKECIDTWLARKNRCPLDNSIIDSSSLVRNLSLEAVIAEITPSTKSRPRRPSPPRPAASPSNAGSRRVPHQPRQPQQPRQPAGPSLLPAFGPLGWLFAFGVVVIATAILFHTPPFPFGSFGEVGYNAAYYQHHRAHAQPKWALPSIPHKLSLSSITYWVRICVDLIIDLVGWILNKFISVIYYMLLGVAWLENIIVRCAQHILRWNWNFFFSSVLYCMQLLGDCLWFMGVTFFAALKFILVATFFVCGIMLKGFVLMLHFGASVVLRVIEAVGL